MTPTNQKIIDGASFLATRTGSQDGLFPMAAGVVVTRGSLAAIRNMNDPPTPQAGDDEDAVAIHELCHFYSTIGSRLLFQQAVQCYFVAKSVQAKIRSFSYFGDQDHICLPLEVDVTPPNCIYNLFHDRGENEIGVDLYEIVEGLATYYQFASASGANGAAYEFMLLQMLALLEDPSTRPYGICYVLLARKLCRRFGRKDGPYVTYHAFPILCWLGLQELRLVEDNVLNHPAQNFEYLADIVCLMGDIWDVLPPREHPDLDAVRHFATVLVSQLVAERQLYIAYEPDWERRGLESLHNELWPKLGPYCWEFQIPFFRAVFCESIQHPVEQLSLLAGLAYPEGRARLLKLVRPMCMNGIAPTRALSVGMPYIKGRPFVEAEIAANAGTDAMFENHEYWPMRLLYSGGSVGYPNFLGSRLWGPLQLCAVAGVFAVALGGQLAEELCSFSECEFHDTGLCRMWPSKPVDRISQCEFREWYMNFFDQRSLLPRTCGHCEQGIRLKVAVTLWPV